MITNERQYRITKAQLKKFDRGIAAQARRERNPDVHPRIHDAMGEALKSQADELRDQVRDYEKLRQGRVKGRRLASLRQLPSALIQGRIAARVTQKGLGDRIRVAEQQVQRWESTGYAGVSFERLQDVADALGVDIIETVRFPTARAPKKRAGAAKAGSTASARTSTKSAAARKGGSSRRTVRTAARRG